jgi:GrpB-like predicted nucleotidyltransferase (UPF0157 family)
MPRPRAVALSPHDPARARAFERERARIQRALAPYALAVEHIGSTAVPGLEGKSTVDIDVGIFRLADAPRCIERLRALGYEYVPEFEKDTPERRYFRIMAAGEAPAEDDFHVHVVEVGSDWFERDLLFRDFLRGHPERARQYEALKRELARKHEGDRDAYTDGKADFVRRVLEDARAERAEHARGRAQARRPPAAEGAPPPP